MLSERTANLDRSFGSSAARQIEIDRPEADQRAVAALLDEFAGENIGVANKVGDEQADRLFVELDRGSCLRDTSVNHHDDAVGDRERVP